MKRKNRFGKFTAFLATCAGITCACTCVLLIAGEYHSARSNLEIHKREVEGWEACRQANPEYYEASEQTARTSRENLAQAQSNFWVKVSKSQLAGFVALGGLGSAAVGYLVTWIILAVSRSIIRLLLKIREFRRFQSCPN